MSGRGAVLTVFALAVAVTQLACGADDDDPAEPSAGRTGEPAVVQPAATEPSAPRRADDDTTITPSAGDTDLAATVVDSETAQDFLSPLPPELTLTAH